LLVRIAVISVVAASTALIPGVPAQAATTNCPPSISNTTVVGNVNVPPSATCQIDNAHITGNVFVNPGAVLLMTGTRVDGSVLGLNPSGTQNGGPRTVCLARSVGVNCGASPNGNSVGGHVSVDGAGITDLCATSVGGSVTIHRGRFYEVGDPTADDGNGSTCQANTIGGALIVRSVDSSGFPPFAGLSPIIEENNITGSVVVSGNQSASRIIIDGNRIGGSLSCSRNTPTPDDLESGPPDPNTTAGAKSGQCATL
jgi:hypothetical protein